MSARNPAIGDSPLELRDLLQWAAQIARAMLCLAGHGITHRALACKNILVFAGRQIKLGKMGRLTDLDVPSLDQQSVAGGEVVSRSTVLSNANHLGVPRDLLRWMVRHSGQPRYTRLLEPLTDAKTFAPWSFFFVLLFFSFRI